MHGKMELNYQATLEDFAEPQIRHYLGTETYRKQRIWEPLKGGAMTMVALLLIGNLTSDFQPSWGLYVLAFGFGWLLDFLTLEKTVSRRIGKHLKRELREKLPASVRYWFEEDRLCCETLSTTFNFDLNSIEDVSEDAERLTISFEDRGLCMIPLRAFDDETQKRQFIDLAQGSEEKPR